YYTVRNGTFFVEDSWKQKRKALIDALYGPTGSVVWDILTFLLPRSWTEYAMINMRIKKARAALDALVGEDIVGRQIYGGMTQYKIRDELKELVKSVLASSIRYQTNVESQIARDELKEIRLLDKEFEECLDDIVENRFDETVEFGKNFSPRRLAEYFRNVFGDVLYFDSFLALIQQYALADVRIVNRRGTTAMFTGFNLSFFGEPGTGKTFAIDSVVRGDEKKGVLPHGLPGRNRYCGGMTAARFIRIGEAYQGRKFNFIIPEFNDWFKYKGMVEPLKLAMEQKDIKYEIKSEVVGPYNFGSFFSVNYNTQIMSRGYRVTVSDPNFNAVEDRMLCRMHRLSQERYNEIAKSQRRLSLGEMDMSLAGKVRDHLTLIYAALSDYPRELGMKKKEVLLSEEIYKRIENARESILSRCGDVVSFSPRLERRAIQLACGMSLINYFRSKGELIHIGKDACDYAIRFFVEESAIRSNEDFDSGEVLKELGLR
ncbi:MAG: hypothetical protein ACXQTP_06450, partial [Candidatus Methanofastidiosia archaeon]